MLLPPSWLLFGLLIHEPTVQDLGPLNQTRIRDALQSLLMNDSRSSCGLSLSSTRVMFMPEVSLHAKPSPVHTRHVGIMTTSAAQQLQHKASLITTRQYSELLNCCSQDARR